MLEELELELCGLEELVLELCGLEELVLELCGLEELVLELCGLLELLDCGLLEELELLLDCEELLSSAEELLLSSVEELLSTAEELLDCCSLELFSVCELLCCELLDCGLLSVSSPQPERVAARSADTISIAIGFFICLPPLNIKKYKKSAQPKPRTCKNASSDCCDTIRFPK